MILWFLNSNLGIVFSCNFSLFSLLPNSSLIQCFKMKSNFINNFVVMREKFIYFRLLQNEKQIKKNEESFIQSIIFWINQ